MTKIALVAATLAGMLTASAASAATTVLDFDTLRNTRPSSVTYVRGPYKEDGFTLTAAQCQASLGVPNVGCFMGAAPSRSSDKVGASLATQLVSTLVTLKRDDGSSFLLRSIDFSEYYDNGIYQPFSTDVIFTFAFADGTSATQTKTFSTDGKFLPTTFTFDVGPLSSVSWKPVTGSGVQFDNITLADVTAAVPEPASWAMMLGGFGLVGGAMRQRKRTLVTA
jgi:subtilisin family serine protease